MSTHNPSTSAYWDDAYDNSKAVGGSEGYAENWVAQATRFRARATAEGRCRLDLAYGERERECFDLFIPEHGSTPSGLVVFVHGGYWMRNSRDVFSHLATGPTAKGWSVAIPSYDLCPNVGLSDIARQMACATEAALEAAGDTALPLRLIGHSAGGHLVTRLASRSFLDELDEENTGNNSPATQLLPDHIVRRIERVVSVSGLHDLRPLLNTGMNETLLMTKAVANSESPALLAPVDQVAITCWVGAQELPELVRQSSLLANIWKGFGADVEAIAEPGKNHFTVIEGLAEANSALVAKLLG